MPCLLLDVDGVIIRDQRLLGHVRHNAARYVKKKLPTCTDPVAINNIMYMGFGHTARGLSAVYQKDSSDFNEFVYDANLMKHLYWVLESDEFINDANTIHNLTCEGWEVTLFSNAPYQWVHPISLAINDKIKIRCPGPDLRKSYLKPEPQFYMEFDTCESYNYVDDSLKNIGAVRNLPNWYPIYFGPHENNLWCPQIETLDDLANKLVYL